MQRLLATVNIVLAMSLLAWPVALFLAIFLFDAPGSERDPILLAFAATILAYPVPIVLGNLMFWSKRKVAPRRSLLNWTLVSCLAPLSLFLLGTLNFSR